MAVMTISRDIGSGGLELARRVAESAGYRLADKSVIELVMREYGFSDFDQRYERTGSFWNIEEELTERTLGFLDQVIRAIARLDRVVIVGRGSFAPLAGFEDVLHVRATAPFPLRVDRVMRERGFEARADAERFVTNRDRNRRGFVARYYGARWEDASPFDMVVNVDSFGLAPLANLLADTLGRLDSGPPRTPSVRDIAADRILLDVAKARLEAAAFTGEDD